MYVSGGAQRQAANRSKYAHVTDWVWLQEEPKNMGAWTYINGVVTDHPLRLISRPASASPATGSHKTHQREQEELLGRVFGF